MVRAATSEEIPAQQGVRRNVEKIPAVPSVRKMRRVDPTKPVHAQGEFFSVGQRTRCTIRDVSNRHHCADHAGHRNSRGSCSEKLVESAALVRLEMRDSDIAKLLDGKHTSNGLSN